MKVVLLRTKTDQAGIGTDLKSTRIKHLFAAPHNPEICPVLTLALYTFATRGVFLAREGNKLLMGRDQKQRYAQLMQRMASQAANDQHGNLDNAGTHSLRKGGITHLLGMMDGPGATCSAVCQPVVSDRTVARSSNCVYPSQLEDRYVCYEIAEQGYEVKMWQVRRRIVISLVERVETSSQAGFLLATTAERQTLLYFHPTSQRKD